MVVIPEGSWRTSFVFAMPARRIYALPLGVLLTLDPERVLAPATERVTFGFLQ